MGNNKRSLNTTVTNVPVKSKSVSSDAASKDWRTQKFFGCDAPGCTHWTPKPAYECGFSLLMIEMYDYNAKRSEQNQATALSYFCDAHRNERKEKNLYVGITPSTMVEELNVNLAALKDPKNPLNDWIKHDEQPSDSENESEDQSEAASEAVVRKSKKRRTVDSASKTADVAVKKRNKVTTAVVSPSKYSAVDIAALKAHNLAAKAQANNNKQLTSNPDTSEQSIHIEALAQLIDTTKALESMIKTAKEMAVKAYNAALKAQSSA